LPTRNRNSLFKLECPKHSPLLVAFYPHIPDSGASHILLRSSSLPDVARLYTPSPVPPISFSQANGTPLAATTGGTLSFPSRHPLLTYVIPNTHLAHKSVPLSGLMEPLLLPPLLSLFPPEIPLRPSSQGPRVARILFGPSTSLFLHPLHTCTSAPPCPYPVILSLRQFFSGKFPPVSPSLPPF
jgi:hypothetical protein